jgi:CheY-like chemotaxis protein
MTSSISVLIADDHPVFREGLTAVISGDDRMHVAGEACDAPAAVASAARLRPDVILMDLSMPGGGLEATRTILTADPRARIMVLTTSNDQDTLFAALRAGVRGYLLKGRVRSRSGRPSGPSSAAWPSAAPRASWWRSEKSVFWLPGNADHTGPPHQVPPAIRDAQ